MWPRRAPALPRAVGGARSPLAQAAAENAEAAAAAAAASPPEAPQTPRVLPPWELLASVEVGDVEAAAEALDRGADIAYVGQVRRGGAPCASPCVAGAGRGCTCAARSLLMLRTRYVRAASHARLPGGATPHGTDARAPVSVCLSAAASYARHDMTRFDKTLSATHPPWRLSSSPVVALCAAERVDAAALGRHARPRGRGGAAAFARRGRGGAQRGTSPRAPRRATAAARFGGDRCHAHGGLFFIVLRAPPRPPACAQGGNTALHLAVGNGREACAALLLSRGADVAAKSATGNTPLHAAALFAQPACVSALLEHGADCSALNEARRAQQRRTRPHSRFRRTLLPVCARR
jgi:hypothetical protein